MESEGRTAVRDELDSFDPWNQGSGSTVIEVGLARAAHSYAVPWMPGMDLTPLSETDSELSLEINPIRRHDPSDQSSRNSTSLAEFVERRFIPEYVATKRSAGRSYFRGILNHVLPPEQVARAFAASPEKMNNKLKTIPGWPYIHSLQLGEISPETIQHLTTVALKHGYSTQTAVHIRNVIRSIFSHAIRTGCYTGDNPASLVTLPAITRKKAHALCLAQLKDVMQAMRYPEKEIALFSILTEMSVAETCGLQWKYVNLSNACRLVEEEMIPPKTIAIRTQCYRGELSVVSGSRRRFVRVTPLLYMVLRDLKSRKQFAAPFNFVLSSRNGTQIHQENVAARRLKFIGKTFDMPWLSWCVFQRTRIALKAELGRKLEDEFERVLPLPRTAMGQPGMSTAD
jgi:integrase